MPSLPAAAKAYSAMLSNQKVEDAARTQRLREHCAVARKERDKLEDIWKTQRAQYEKARKQEKITACKRMQADKSKREERWLQKTASSPFGVDLWAEDEALYVKHTVNNAKARERERLTLTGTLQDRQDRTRAKVGEIDTLGNLRKEKKKLLEDQKELKARLDLDKVDKRCAAAQLKVDMKVEAHQDMLADKGHLDRTPSDFCTDEMLSPMEREARRKKMGSPKYEFLKSFSSRTIAEANEQEQEDMRPEAVVNKTGAVVEDNMKERALDLLMQPRAQMTVMAAAQAENARMSTDKDSKAKQEAEYDRWMAKQADWAAQKAKLESMEEQAMACPSGHLLEKFATDEDGYECNECGRCFRRGTTLHGCRRCEYDVCNSCAKKLVTQLSTWVLPEKKQKEEEDLKSRAMALLGSEGARASVKAAAEAENARMADKEAKAKQDAEWENWVASQAELAAQQAKSEEFSIEGVVCENGHQLEKHTTEEDGYECNDCGRCVRTGTAIYCCRQCEYDLCSNCAKKKKADMTGA